MPTFAERFAALSARRSPLCLGLDAAGDLVSVVKPQAAFFERFGPAGMGVLATATAQIRAQGSLVLIDAKRGDVASTMAGYAGGLLGPDSGFGGDAVTLHAYLGLGALAPVVARARATAGAVFVVVHASNPEGRMLQTARQADGRTVAEALADGVTALNAPGEAVGPVGAVIGATLAAQDTPLVTRLPRSLILAPGVGAQGASLADVAARFQGARGRVLPSVSRAILAQGPDRGALRASIRRHRDEAARLLGG